LFIDALVNRFLPVQPAGFDGIPAVLLKQSVLVVESNMCMLACLHPRLSFGVENKRKH